MPSIALKIRFELARCCSVNIDLPARRISMIDDSGSLLRHIRPPIMSSEVSPPSSSTKLTCFLLMLRLVGVTGSSLCTRSISNSVPMTICVGHAFKVIENRVVRRERVLVLW